MNITIKPIEKIQISSIQKTELETLVKKEAISESPCLYWCNEIIFIAYDFSSDKIQAERINGIHYVSEVCYAEHKEFTEYVKWDCHPVEVLNMTGHSLYEPLTKFLGELK